MAISVKELNKEPKFEEMRLWRLNIHRMAEQPVRAAQLHSAEC
jgi:hypothetical protein